MISDRKNAVKRIVALLVLTAIFLFSLVGALDLHVCSCEKCEICTNIDIIQKTFKCLLILACIFSLFNTAAYPVVHFRHALTFVTLSNPVSLKVKLSD